MKKAICVILVMALSFGMLGTLGACGKADVSASISEAKVTLPASTGVRSVVEGEAVLSTQVYLLVRSYFVQIENYDTQQFDAHGYRDLLAQSTEACRVASAMIASLEEHADALSKAEESGTLESQEQAKYEQVSWEVGASGLPGTADVAYAAEEESAAVKYAQAITKTFDEAKNGQKLKTLAQQYGTDVKKAKAMLDQAQAILEGAAYSDQAAFENTCYKVAVATKAAASTVGFVASVAATGGVAGFVEAGGIVCNGIGAALDVGKAVTICATAGEGNKYTVILDKMSDTVAPITTVFSIAGGVSNIKNFMDPQKVADQVDNAAQALLVGVGLASDYLPADTVMTVSANTANGEREVVIESAKTSDKQACEEVLKRAGFSQEEIDGTAGEDGTNLEQQLADSYVDSLGFLADPSNPYDVDAYVAEVDKRYQECAAVESSAPADSASDAGTPSASGSEGSASNSDTLPASEVAGTYEFSKLGTEIVTYQDDGHLVFTDSTGASAVGSYDESTGIWFLQDEGEYNGEPITATMKATFSRIGNGIKAHVVMTMGDEVADGGSAVKQ